MANTIIIAAVCARPFVQAASAAGYRVIALDVFADADTRQAADETYRLDYAEGRFDSQQLLRELHALDCRNTAGLVYGSGFEAVPELLEEISRLVPVVGNSPEVLRQLKDPLRFFDLLAQLRIAHPEARFQLPEQTAGWLRKHGGGSGGTHVQRLQCITATSLGPYGYYQREITGEPVSMLFAADGREARAIGFNRQWVAPAVDMPFRYGGAASHAVLPYSVEQQLVHAAQQITQSVGLRGLNSIDAIMHGDSVEVLEINPRLSATFDLYCDDSGSLFDLHVHACAGDISNWPQIPMQSRAQYIVYAPHTVTIAETVAWPAWVMDVPPVGAVIAAGSPLCSVNARASSEVEAKALAQARASKILNLITQKTYDQR